MKLTFFKTYLSHLKDLSRKDYFIYIHRAIGFMSQIWQNRHIAIKKQAFSRIMMCSAPAQMVRGKKAFECQGTDRKVEQKSRVATSCKNTGKNQCRFAFAIAYRTN